MCVCEWACRGVMRALTHSSVRWTELEESTAQPKQPEAFFLQGTINRSIDSVVYFDFGVPCFLTVTACLKEAAPEEEPFVANRQQWWP